eukprot:2126425-Pyramimonas_sp.AAC.1
MQDVSEASNIMTSGYVRAWKFVKNEKGEMDVPSCYAWHFGVSWTSKPSVWRRSQGRRGGRVSDCSSARQRARSRDQLRPSHSQAC